MRQRAWAEFPLWMVVSVLALAWAGCNPAGGDDDGDGDGDGNPPPTAKTPEEVQADVDQRAAAAGVQRDEEVVVRFPQKERGGRSARLVAGQTVTTPTSRERFTVTYGYDLAADTDGDGLRDDDETGNNPLGVGTGTDPNNPDTDGDGLEDGVEVLCTHTDPRNADTDGDGIRDGDEANPNDPASYSDEDNDGLPRIVELASLNTNPNNSNTDGDALSDGAEFFLFLVATVLDVDSDGDGWPDIVELAFGTDPNNRSSVPGDSDGDGIPDSLERFFAIDGSGEAQLPTFSSPLEVSNSLVDLVDRLAFEIVDAYGAADFSSQRDADYFAIQVSFLQGRSIDDIIEVMRQLGQDISADQAQLIQGFVREFGPRPQTARNIYLCLFFSGFEYSAQNFISEANSTFCLWADGFTQAEVDAYLNLYDAAINNEVAIALSLRDSDGDGFDDHEEINTGSNPLNSNSTPFSDQDGDELLDIDEVFFYGTDPFNFDTDGDGLFDGTEVLSVGSSPFNPNTDGDAVNDFDEVFVYGTNPLAQDTDGDGFNDGFELFVSFSDPLDPFDP